MRIYRSLKMLKEIPKVRKADKVVLITSAKLKRKLGWAIKEIEELILPSFEVVIIPDGEKAKTWDVLEKLLARFVKLRLTKKSIAVAFGGGSVSDLVGLACSIYKGEAVSYINIPTTLLSQVDASIGGKTAVDFKGHKNLIRAFYNPIAIFRIDGFLKSLSKEQFVDGLAEIIKAGLIKDPVIFDTLDFYGMTRLRKAPILLGRLILRAITVKEYFVSQDPKDLGVRHALNSGHTFAHSLELKYGLSHGMAVLIGMLLELRAFEQMGINTLEARVRLSGVLKCLGISLDLCRFKINRRDIAHDKKISGKEIVMPIVRKVGCVKLVKISLDKLMVAIENCN